jgi:predicted nucleic acid-binding Zn ribbon protein
MNELEVRSRYKELTSGRTSLRGFWHTKDGRALREQVLETPFAEFNIMQEKIWSLQENCEICSSRASFYQYGFLETCSKSCGSVLNNKNQKQNNPEMFYSQMAAFVAAAATPESNAKRKASLKSTYLSRGVHIAQQRIKTSLEKYGVPHPKQCTAVKDKTSSTMISRYGVNTVLSSPEHIKKSLETKRLKFERTVLPEKLKQILRKQNVTALFSEYVRGDFEYPWKHLTCGTEFKHMLIDGCTPRCPRCKPKSRPQEAVYKICESLGCTVKENDRTVIKPYEIDLWLPEHDIGIEINGVYWHHDGTAAPALVKKSKMLPGLLHFWDFEINKKLSLVQNVISTRTGKLKRKIPVSACEIQVLDQFTAESFLNKNDLAGFKAADLHVSVLYNQEIVHVASFRVKDSSISLVSFCSVLDTDVQGVLAELAEWTCRTYKLPVRGRADLRFSDGSEFSNAGFKALHALDPDYFYTRNRHVLKSSDAAGIARVLGKISTSTSSEDQAMFEHGWLKCSDAGSVLYRYDPGL